MSAASNHPIEPKGTVIDVVEAVEGLEQAVTTKGKLDWTKVIAVLLTLITAISGTGLYSIVQQADEIAKLPKVVDDMRTVLVGTEDSLGRRSPGLIDQFKSESEANRRQMKALTSAMEEQNERLEKLEHESHEVKAHVVPGPVAP